MTTPHSVVDVHHPVSGDVIDLIIDDHYLMEHLLRQLRDASSDREALRAAFAAVHVAHARAEELHVYPALQRRARHVGEHEAEHGREEHAEGNEALLRLLEVKGTDTQKFEDALEELSATVAHHLVEEELTIVNPARTEVTERVRRELGEKFCTERARQLSADCGSLANVRRVVSAADSEGLLDEE